MKKITVYGSLLEGLHNWSWHLNNEESTKLGEHVLEGPFHMVSFGGFPGLIFDSSVRNKIFAETYEVSDDVYRGIERLEGYPTFYTRMPVETPFGPSEVYVLARASRSENTLPPNDGDVINWKKYKTESITSR